MIPFQFVEIFRKLSSQQALNEGELQAIGLHFEEMQQTKTKLDALFVPGTNVLNIPMAFEVIASLVFEQNVTDYTLEIPSKYKHLIIIGSGRNTAATTNSDYLLAQYNADSAANYINQFFFAVHTSLTGTRDTAATEAVVGLLADGGRAADDASSFFTVIPHSGISTLNKSAFSMLTPPYGSFYATGANWDGTDPIASIKFFSGGGDNIAAGTSLSVYGLR